MKVEAPGLAVNRTVVSLRKSSPSPVRSSVTSYSGALTVAARSSASSRVRFAAGIDGPSVSVCPASLSTVVGEPA